MGHASVVTIWFVDNGDPAAVLRSEPKPDRGFGRKLLAQLNPTWPITPIGEFPLNRSSAPGEAEFYIAGYPGVAVVQTLIDDVNAVSEIAPQLRAILPATDIYVCAIGTESDFAGFAHFTAAGVRRAFAGTRETVIEDIGLPDSVELPYWSGEKAEQIGGISLPFVPRELAQAAQEAWIGVPVSPEGPDIHVVGYAVDGRPEPKIEAKAPATKSVAEVAAKFAEQDKVYDDYELSTSDEGGDEFAQLADASLAAARRVARSVRRGAVSLARRVNERVRHFDR
ncbi:DUF6928 family protein [Corynebacterium sp.]|uniref:DUF6928 family protein n=1 Tax=Corynebacterium sp. TaxID=1720 RepID=UPI002A910641|nr:hypothetical protein [Corynebacterium sp.]MDY5785320.1 hypothetical protein [Corynebacterium sp.]